MKPVVLWHCTQPVRVLKSYAVQAAAVTRACPELYHWWRAAWFAALSKWQSLQEEREVT